MSEPQENGPEQEAREGEDKPLRFPELAELEEKIQRRLRSNQRFLERFMDEDYDDLDDDDSTADADVDDPGQEEEL